MPEASTGMAAAMAVITNSQMVVQYLKSTQIIEDMIAAGVDLDAIYTGSDRDLWAHLRRNASLEERQRYWKSMVDPFFDLSNGIVSVEVRAFHPADAQLVARTALALCEKLMNDISVRTHADSSGLCRKGGCGGGRKDARGPNRNSRLPQPTRGAVPGDAGYSGKHNRGDRAAGVNRCQDRLCHTARPGCSEGYNTDEHAAAPNHSSEIGTAGSAWPSGEDRCGRVARFGATEYNQLQAFEQNAGEDV